MIRKGISTILVLCLVANCFSCYSSKTERIYDLSEAFPPFDYITVYTKDGGDYTFTNAVVLGKTLIGRDEESESMEIPIGDILYVEVATREFKGFESALVMIGGAVLVAVVAFGILLAVASCPHVSSFDGESWVLEAEPNGGAVVKPLEYVDYNVMRRLKVSDDGTCRIRLENRLEEVDFNNELKLLAADHDPGVRIIPDVNGDLAVVSGIDRPYYAVTDGGVDLLQEMDADGRLFWDGDINKSEYDDAHPRDEIHLKFKRPAGANGGVLVFEGSSTFWSTYIMADFLSRFGSSASKRLKRLEHDPVGREKAERFMIKSGYHIEVLLRSGGEWVHAGYLRTAGTYVSKIQALRMDLPDDGGGDVEVKLSYAPYFWNVMDLGMGFTGEDAQFEVTELAPIEAVDTKRGDIRDLLLARDDLYYRAERGDRAEISFSAPPVRESLERTFILKTSGYYTFILDEEKEMPFLSKVWHAVKRQGIDGYSLEKYREIQEQAGN
jgi:hypothetical protein